MTDSVGVAHFSRIGRKILLQIMPVEVYERRIETDSPDGIGSSVMFPADGPIATLTMEVEEFDGWLSQVNRWWERMQTEKPWEKE